MAERTKDTITDERLAELIDKQSRIIESWSSNPADKPDHPDTHAALLELQQRRAVEKHVCPDDAPFCEADGEE